MTPRVRRKPCASVGPRLSDEVALTKRACVWCGREAYDLHPDGDGGWECAMQSGCLAPHRVKQFSLVVARRAPVRATVLPGGQRVAATAQGDAHGPHGYPAVHQGARPCGGRR